MQNSKSTPDVQVPNPQVKRELGVSYQTLRRYERHPTLGYPPPIWRNGRKYQWRSKLDEFKARSGLVSKRGFK